MQVQIGSGGSSTQAASLVDVTFDPCADGAYRLTNEVTGQTATMPAVRRILFNADHTVAKSGDVRILLRIRTRLPLSSYNVNGTVVTNVPEFQIHTVLTLPKVVVAALQGTLTTSPGTQNSVETDSALWAATQAIAEAITFMSTIMSNQPVNITNVTADLSNSLWFKGTMGVCPVNYATADFGQTRVLPPPQRS